MNAAQRHFRSIQAAFGRGWLVLALVVLWAQFVSAAHQHGEAGDAAGHRVGSCVLCIAQSTPAAPPPEPVLVREPPATLPAPSDRAPAAADLADRPTPQAPRAPPPRHHA